MPNPHCQPQNQGNQLTIESQDRNQFALQQEREQGQHSLDLKQPRPQMAEPVGFAREGQALRSTLIGHSSHTQKKQPFCQKSIKLHIGWTVSFMCWISLGICALDKGTK